MATIPAIITQEVFDLAQAKLAQNQSFAKRNNKAHHYLLRALVSCGRCQAACIGRHAQNGPSYYVCSAKGNPIHTRREEKCRSRFSPAGQLDELVWQDLCYILSHPDSITQAVERAHGGQWLPQQLQARRENLRRGQARLQQQLDRLTEAYLHEVIPLAEYQRRRADLAQRVEAFQQQEQQLNAQAKRHTEITALVNSVEDFCQRIQTGLDQATFEQKRQLVELLIDRVIVNDGDVEIRYVIPTSPESELIRFCHLRSDYFCQPYAVRPISRELLVKPIGGDRQLMVTICGHHPERSDRFGFQVVDPHQPCHPFTAIAETLFSQFSMDPITTIRFPALLENILDMHQQDQICHLPRAEGLLPPLVVAIAGHFQEPAHHCDWIFLAVLLNELVFHRWLRVKPVLSLSKGWPLPFLEFHSPTGLA